MPSVHFNGSRAQTEPQMSSTVFPPDEQVIDERTAARSCGISVATLRRRVAAGTGPKRIQLSDRRIGYKPRHLREWLDANTEAQTEGAVS
jgi:predicted DNA-binding transcriptional regulator AlpA